MNALDSLTAAPKREKIHDDVINVKLPKAVKAMVTAEAKRRDVTAGAIVREALGDYLYRKGYAEN